jgi:hypothetical protein
MTASLEKPDFPSFLPSHLVGHPFRIIGSQNWRHETIFYLGVIFSGRCEPMRNARYNR